MVFLACDGGSTKTEWLLSDEKGNILAHTFGRACNYTFIGADGIRRVFESSIHKLLDSANLSPNEISSASLSITIYGEMPETEEKIPVILREILPYCKYIRISNDSVAGWSGSLGHRAGINIVSGTGSIAYGRDYSGRDCRAGGWSLFFADEGSCSWIGREVLAEFAKQADGRKTRTLLYKNFKEYIGIENDAYIAGYMQNELMKDSSALASIQKLAQVLAIKGDKFCLNIYHRAVDELKALAVATRNRLDFKDGEDILLSYSGGLFKTGELVLQEFCKEMKSEGFSLITPMYSPLVGALALAAEEILEDNEIDELMSRAQEDLRRKFF